MDKYYWKCTADCPRHCAATSTDNANPWTCLYADYHDCKWAKVDKPTRPDPAAEALGGMMKAVGLGPDSQNPHKGPANIGNDNYRSLKCRTCDKLRCGNCIYGPHRTNYPKADNYSPAKKGKGGTIGGDRDINPVSEKIIHCFMCNTKLRRIKTIKNQTRHYYCPKCEESGVDCDGR